ncbi:uncharacterized protein CANTADRAFT_4110 [Suhomyces tanzawaensis NRRL Y-17324]|uniref:Sorting nexin MVP1 n=1 Tax=Suhomyces tanzawaensis NRRL Y-17324 TaxID=984487 RepID=A0A1E4SRD0_9ASCO|nr:uncharacterized protein CANTADRAFT_4110 [Suhomyces tanzawaensis NRRL Y-17324]ODV82070.1 hypothetical protein CANTADRAFT_4110 [Suhomyces tanzawaensis NRRL Y-17324]
MSSSLYGSGDPWENGWASSEDQQRPAFGTASNYLTSSQLLTTVEEPERLSVNTSRVPESFKRIQDGLGARLTSVEDVENFVFSKVVQLGYLKKYQTAKIVDTLYDHNLVTPSSPNTLVQILGLVSLEIDATGTGDFVTLQFRLGNLPELPQELVTALLARDEPAPSSDYNDFIDPLSAQLANTSINENDAEDWTSRPGDDIPDPLLHDNSTTISNKAILEPDTDEGQAKPILDSSITKHVEEIRDRFKPLINTNDLIKIKEVPEKEGLLFKHINYFITHDLRLGMNSHSGTKKVIRRYSDFVWLLEFLLQKYPFRVIPGLPPKKFSVGSSPDSQFLQRRRRGLHRFLNQLIKHPVLKQEPVVITFLTVPTDISTWKKQAKIDYSLEFKGQKIQTHFINSIWPTIGKEFLQNWANAENSIAKLIETWTKTVLLIERYEKRQQQISYDNNKFVEMISSFKAGNASLYPASENSIIGENNKDDMGTINESLGYISEFFNKSSQVLIDESYSVNTGILEKFKNYLDYLYSLQELFERTKRLSANNIDQLEARIKENEAKYKKLSTEEADVKGADLAKLRQVIINDKQEIFQQLNKDWLIKNCCFEEYIMFQETQYLVSELWIEWTKGRLRFLEKMNGLQTHLNGEIENNMPLSR